MLTRTNLGQSSRCTHLSGAYFVWNIRIHHTYNTDLMPYNHLEYYIPIRIPILVPLNVSPAKFSPHRPHTNSTPTPHQLHTFHTFHTNSTPTPHQLHTNSTHRPNYTPYISRQTSYPILHQNAHSFFTLNPITGMYILPVGPGNDRSSKCYYLLYVA